MKQKILIKVPMKCDKCRSKALRLVASVSGVDLESVEITGEDKNQLVVVGDGVDVVGLTTALRKKMGRAEIVQVGEAKKKEEKTETTSTETAYPQAWWYPGYYSQPAVVYKYP